MDKDVIIYQPMQFVYYFALARINYDYNIQLKTFSIVKDFEMRYRQLGILK